MMERPAGPADRKAEGHDDPQSNRFEEENTVKLIDLALQEDLGKAGDVTSSALFREEVRSLVLVGKESGILAGIDIFCQVFHRVDPETKIACNLRDGDEISPGETVCEIAGKAASLLSAERVALNFLSFLSGIATATKRYVALASKHGKAKILDTRKTLPGYRSLSKYAVRLGGGENHRLGLYDMILIKDNHIDLAGSIAQAVTAIRRRWKDNYRIEVECRSMGEVEDALNAGADIIMLDNMELPDIRRAVELARQRHGGTKLEASGNVSLNTVGDLSAAGVDFISVGRITHSAKALDFSLLYRHDSDPETGGGVE